MNRRQNELLRLLLVENNKAYFSQELAKLLGCSERTIRNDLTTITSELEGSADIIRKPGAGIRIEVNDAERQRLLEGLFQVETGGEEELTMNIAYELLMSKKPVTLKILTEHYFISRQEVKSEIDKINEWLSYFGLSIVSKQKIGFLLDGSELTKRNALAHLPQLYSLHAEEDPSITRLFPSFEVEAVKKALSKLPELYADNALERLLVHMLIMTKRTKLGNTIRLTDLEKETVKERQEYQYAINVLEELEPVFNLRYPDEEKLYFAWHLMSSKRRTPLEEDRLKTSQLVEMLTDKMTGLTSVNFRNDEVLYQGLSTHLQSVIHRIAYGLTVMNPLLKEIKRMYPYLVGMVILALEEIRAKYDIIVPEEEAAYIVLHFQAALERQQRVSHAKKKAIVVCHMGIGMSRLLQARLEQTESDLDIVDCIAKSDLNAYLETEKIDMIISTVEIETDHIPSVVVSPLLDEKDKERVSKLVTIVKSDGALPSGESALQHFIDENSIFVNVDLEHPYEVIEMLANQLHDRGLVRREYAHTALLRERTSGTAIGSGVAIPHGNPAGILKSGIAVALLKRPLEWDGEWVSIVFLLAVAGEKEGLMKQLFRELSEVSEKPALVKRLTDKEIKESADFIKRLQYNSIFPDERQ